MKSLGIVSFGVHIPRLRLLRSAIAAAHKWASPSPKGPTRGARAYCAFDEDCITMAVAAARHALGPRLAAGAVRELVLASTSLPFADRQNAVVVAEALGLDEQLHSADLAGSQRAGTGALIQALRNPQPTLVVASDRAAAKPGSPLEYSAGDAAAAIGLGHEGVLARCLGVRSAAVDFVDHYRGAQARFDYALEERWVREEGYLKIVPPTVKALLGEAGVDAASIDRFVLGAPQEAAAKAIAKKCGIREEAVHPGQQEQFGYSGCAYALAMLADALQVAEPGERILLVGFGQGCDALLFEATGEVHAARELHGVAQALAAGRTDDNYMRYLAASRLVEMDWGMRVERDMRTAQSAHYRQRRAITGLVGGRCSACDALQFPRTQVCVNPDCNRHGTQQPESLAGRTGHIKSFTEDWLALSFSPPLMYGNVSFGDRAVMVVEFTNFDPGQIAIGVPVRMEFRIKDFDPVRGFHRYFWKAAPATGA